MIVCGAPDHHEHDYGHDAVYGPDGDMLGWVWPKRMPGATKKPGVWLARKVGGMPITEHATREQAEEAVSDGVDVDAILEGVQ